MLTLFLSGTNDITFIYNSRTMTKHTINIPNKQHIITDRLQARFNPSLLEVMDESDQHVGHAGHQGGGRHFAVKISSTHFNHLSRVACHRLIYQTLADLMPHDIHALRIEVV